MASSRITASSAEPSGSRRKGFGRIDMLVNNAGRGLFGMIEETSQAQARDQFETNFFGTVNDSGRTAPGDDQSSSSRSRRDGGRMIPGKPAWISSHSAPSGPARHE